MTKGLEGLLYPLRFRKPQGLAKLGGGGVFGANPLSVPAFDRSGRVLRIHCGHEKTADGLSGALGSIPLLQPYNPRIQAGIQRLDYLLQGHGSVVPGSVDHGFRHDLLVDVQVGGLSVHMTPGGEGHQRM